MTVLTGIHKCIGAIYPQLMHGSWRYVRKGGQQITVRFAAASEYALPRNVEAFAVDVW